MGLTSDIFSLLILFYVVAVTLFLILDLYSAGRPMQNFKLKVAELYSGESIKNSAE